jgi:hypothetical protein
MFQDTDAGVGEIIDGKKFSAWSAGAPYSHCWGAGYLGFMETANQRSRYVAVLGMIVVAGPCIGLVGMTVMKSPYCYLRSPGLRVNADHAPALACPVDGEPSHIYIVDTYVLVRNTGASPRIRGSSSQSYFCVGKMRVSGSWPCLR